MIRSSSINFSKYWANIVLSRTNVVLRTVKISSSDRRKFSDTRARSTKPVVDSNNIFRSPYKGIENFTGIYMHDYVWRNIDNWPDKTALVCTATGESYTYYQARKAAGRLATALRKKCQLNPGDKVAAILPNSPQYAITILGASEAGIRLIVISAAFTTEEMRTQLINSHASAVITTASKYPVVEASVAGNSAIKLPIIVVEDSNGEAPEGTIKFRDLIRDDIEEFEKSGEKTGLDPEDAFLMPLSSGTSGLPKIVQLSHRNIVANLKQNGTEGVTTASEATANDQEIVPLIIPMSHVFGLFYCFASYLCLGAKLLCIPQFSGDNLFRVLEENRATLLCGPPSLFQMISSDRRLKNRHLETMRRMITGAAPISEEILDKLVKYAPSNVDIVQGYGLSECTVTVSLSMDSPFAAVGRPIPSTDIRIVARDPHDQVTNLSINQPGEIYVRGPQVMKGYYNNPAATSDCMEGDWLKTGDLGCIDENGFLHIRARLKELIKVQGYQVAPAEIEHLIQRHEKVADAAVIGVAHEKYGQVPKAFVVVKDGVQLEPEEIKTWVAKHFAKYKHLGHVQSIDKIPKSTAGKILRRELEKM